MRCLGTRRAATTRKERKNVSDGARRSARSCPQACLKFLFLWRGKCTDAIHFKYSKGFKINVNVFQLVSFVCFLSFDCFWLVSSFIIAFSFLSITNYSSNRPDKSFLPWISSIATGNGVFCQIEWMVFVTDSFRPKHFWIIKIQVHFVLPKFHEVTLIRKMLDQIWKLSTRVPCLM